MGRLAVFRHQPGLPVPAGRDPRDLYGTWKQNEEQGAQDNKSPGHGKASLGGGFALLRIPRFGDDYQMPIIKGVHDDALAAGVGWFPQTQGPGQIGNFALAGHRVTNGEPFRHFPDLRVGDTVYVETQTHIYTYTLDDNGTDHKVRSAESWIIDPVPGHAGAKPSKSLITLSTCSELFRTNDRSYAFGHLTNAETKPQRR